MWACSITWVFLFSLGRVFTANCLEGAESCIWIVRGGMGEGLVGVEVEGWDWTGQSLVVVEGGVRRGRPENSEEKEEEEDVKL